ncbi:MAG: peptidoglycan-binding protein [Chthoniobacterales bacterium]|nr:peptidoglycan-binding protein [Chthoniobacterales bacterium]
MKKFTALLIGCSLALAGVALAQQPTEEASPGAKKQGGDKKHAAEAKPGAEAKPNAGTQGAAGTKAETKSQAAGARAKEQGAAGAKAGKADATTKSGAAASTEATGSAQPAASASSDMTGQAQKGKGANAKPSPSASPDAAASASAKPAPAPAASAAPPAAPSASITPAAATSASAAASAPVAGQPAAQAGAGMGAKKKPEPQQVQQIKQQHANFRAQPRPDRVPAVTFQQNYRIQGVDRWQGPQYEVYRAYRPERHDEGWYRSRYQRVELIGGGYYYFNSGYWYPAWGFNPTAEYYAYDAPIYVGQRAEPPDRVIADVQGVLQQMGYYKGEVDGLLGPMTREALTAYQSEQGLMATAVIDQPTLDALGMG